MKILKRYHNSTGITVQYLVSSDGRTARLSVQEVVTLYNRGLIENATLTHSGEFRAKSGWHIDTEILPDSLPVVKHNESLLNVQGSDLIC